MSKSEEVYAYQWQPQGKFAEACTRAGILPTKRQWRKWCRGIGAAYISRKETVNN